MPFATYLIEYLDGSWEYIPSKKFRKAFQMRRMRLLIEKPSTYILIHRQTQ